MNAKGISQVSVGATAMPIAAQAPAAGEPWRVVEQPELQQALENAPVLIEIHGGGWRRGARS